MNGNNAGIDAEQRERRALNHRKRFGDGDGVDGISPRNIGTDLTINAATERWGNDGISADNDGTGALSITATGAVTAGRASDGIYATQRLAPI